METYHTFTRQELIDMFDYDLDKGSFIRKSDGKRMIDFKYDCRNKEKKQVSLYLNRVAFIIVADWFLDAMKAATPKATNTDPISPITKPSSLVNAADNSIMNDYPFLS